MMVSAKTGRLVRWFGLPGVGSGEPPRRAATNILFCSGSNGAVAGALRASLCGPRLRPPNEVELFVFADIQQKNGRCREAEVGGGPAPMHDEHLKQASRIMNSREYLAEVDGQASFISKAVPAGGWITNVKSAFCQSAAEQASSAQNGQPERTRTREENVRGPPVPEFSFTGIKAFEPAAFIQFFAEMTYRGSRRQLFRVFSPRAHLPMKSDAACVLLTCQTAQRLCQGIMYQRTRRLRWLVGGRSGLDLFLYRRSSPQSGIFEEQTAERPPGPPRKVSGRMKCAAAFHFRRMPLPLTSLQQMVMASKSCSKRVPAQPVPGGP